jgi:putative ABC transport system ATP-binding protein
VQENVELSLLLGGAGAREAGNRALEVLQMVGIAARAKQRPAALSGGERQRVAIARALVNHPAIVWADEPTGNLDRKTSEITIQLMRRLNQQNGQTFVIVTHDLMVGRMCDRIIYMRDGAIVNEDEDFGRMTAEISQEA